MASFLYFRLFYKQSTVNICSITVADDWILTRVLWYWKQPLCQLRHNYCPSSYCMLSVSILSVNHFVRSIVLNAVIVHFVCPSICRHLLPMSVSPLSTFFPCSCHVLYSLSTLCILPITYLAHVIVDTHLHMFIYLNFSSLNHPFHSV